MSLTAGTRLGPYEIISLVGSGGMGEVYRAHDPRLGRDVAVKVLPESVASDAALLSRLEQEARVIAALSHANVLAIFDVGRDVRPFLVTELLEGETLRARLTRETLPLTQVLDIAGQVVSGLAAVHVRGIVHRDLKPDNIFITRDGVVKILDFGVATATGPPNRELSDDDATRLPLPVDHSVVGTLGYMAPEQIRGMPVDPRTDVFAMGTVLYEMVSGRRAFRGATGADTMSAVLRERVPDLTGATPPALAWIIRRCLEKEPNDRFQSAGDLKSALQSVTDLRPGATAGQKPGEPSIAVLPFSNLSADPDNQYFSDGLSEELINALTRLPGLHVASRTSSFRFRARDADIREIGATLRVAAVLEGSVRRAGNRLRVTAQLVNVEDGYQIWSERYDREMADVFDIQDDIVEAIVKALALALSGDERRVVKRPTDNLQAYELYLKGRHYWHQRSPATLQMAIRSFEQVIGIDPDYALAYAGLSDCYAIYRTYGLLPARASQPKALDAITRAMALDPSLAEVNFSQALYMFYFDPNWRSAATHLQRALEINPRFAAGRSYLGIVYAVERRDEEAVIEVGLARDIEPLSPFIHYLAALTFNVMGRFTEAERAARQCLELQPDSIMGMFVLGTALSSLGRAAEAIATSERVVTILRAPICVGMLGQSYAAAGRVEDARRLLQELEERASRGDYVAPVCALEIDVGLGDVVRTRAALEQCIDDRTPPLTVACTCGPALERLRSDPAINDLLDRFFGAPATT